ncbi:MAG: glutamine synthetase III [Clostridiales bacterium]|nr:glutamine synthetase III [Clostridiales bacterium]
MRTVEEYFGENVFNESVMKSRLPKEAYKAVKEAIDHGKRLTPEVAGVIANEMKQWAVEKGATHYTHWFQPLTGITAEKHDSFIAPQDDGKVIMHFSGKELIQGEPDASSFPSGGIRATFEARGYTAWDPTSFAFIKDGVLCIPTAFCSYNGEALDKKTPLLRSMEAINKQALRIMKIFGKDDVTSIRTTVGPEQEYFLIDKKMYDQRKDLIYTGRTLFGALPPKGQQMEDHYFGVIKPRVQAFMKDLNEELWKLGILATTEHNEVAPAQHELAPIFTTTNIAADHNQLTMEIMQKVARKHDLVCLLHEKPFEGVNGSGKHNNWSISTDTGINLLDPGDTPRANASFLLFLTAVISAVDTYQDLLRLSVASAGNDHRLGANEAPPAIISIFLGSELTEILDSIVEDRPYGSKEKEIMKIGVHVLPRFPKDTTDRNRTSPFAFTGNKFEFRMLGSAASIAMANTVLNAAVAEVLSQFADKLEGVSDFESALHDLIKSEITAHKRILFNGNGYDDSWVAEAEKRGLSNYKTLPDAVKHYLDPKNVELLTKHNVYSEVEMNSRHEIFLEKYCKLLNIEYQTMSVMAKQDILPAVSAYSAELASGIAAIESAGGSADFEKETFAEITADMNAANKSLKALNKLIAEFGAIDDYEVLADKIKDEMIPAMDALRANCDKLELETAAEYWPFPTYGELLFGVR